MSHACVELPAISVVIPAHNAEHHLALCLEAVARSQPAPLECIVIDDGSSDKTAEIARNWNVRLLQPSIRKGPAAARNLGARAATGALLLFIDSDVIVHANTIRLMAEAFRDDPELDALMGCYDDSPAANNFASQFEGLHHHYMHQSASLQVRGLAGFCSAVKREVFLDAGGFDETYRRPMVEDVELGLRLSQEGKKLRLMKQAQVTHLKRWDLLGLVRAEVFSRALPWARLMLRTRSLANDLNLAASQKLSGILVLLGISLFPIGLVVRSPGLIALAITSLTFVVVLNRGFYKFVYARRGTWFLVRTIPLHFFYFLYASVGFAAGTGAHLFEALKSRAIRLPSHMRSAWPALHGSNPPRQ